MLLPGCTSAPGGRHAQVVEYGSPHNASETKRPVITYLTPDKINQNNKNGSRNKNEDVVEQFYLVQKGDTLYSIAFQHGVDYREIAQLNKLANPAEIKIGQQLRLLVPVPGTAAKPVESVSVSAMQLTPIGGIKNQPKVGKIPYSPQAMAQAERMQNELTVGVATNVEVKPVNRAHPVNDSDSEESLEWGMPTIGKVITTYSENANRKGVDIEGKKGQPVVASASGKVVYSGSGLRGYGKLIIIKHNKTFLSAYAHNDQIMVREGQNISKGEKIGEMGNTDAEQVKLHFEIRKFGKPVDPAQYLPLFKS
jgi:lipoprotein NlpD